MMCEGTERFFSNSVATRAEVADSIRSGLAEIEAFTASSAFQNVLNELWDIAIEQRHYFVTDILLDSDELAKRGVIVPDGMKIMRSSFRDDRPTLFCVVRYVKAGVGWSKVTITFDNPVGQPAVLYSDIRSKFDREALSRQIA